MNYTPEWAIILNVLARSSRYLCYDYFLIQLKRIFLKYILFLYVSKKKIF